MSNMLERYIELRNKELVNANTALIQTLGNMTDVVQGLKEESDRKNYLLNQEIKELQIQVDFYEADG